MTLQTALNKFSVYSNKVIKALKMELPEQAQVEFQIDLSTMMHCYCAGIPPVQAANVFTSIYDSKIKAYGTGFSKTNGEGPIAGTLKADRSA